MAALFRFVGGQVINDKLAGDGYQLSNDMIMTIYRGKKSDNV